MPTQVDESATSKFVVTNTLIVNDIQRSVAFYRDVLGAAVLREGEPTFYGSATSGLLSTVEAVPPTISLKSSLRHHAIPTS